VDTLLFIALLSGPPQFTGSRDPAASLSGQLDATVIARIAVWAVGALWVAGRLSRALMVRGVIPRVNRLQLTCGLLLVSLTLSLPESPGFLLTAFTVGQYAVMLSFSWIFVHRYGTYAFLRLLFAGVVVLVIALALSVFVAPDLVFQGTRLRGDGIADTATVAMTGLILALCNMPRLRPAAFWALFVVFGLLLTSAQTRTAYIALAAFLLVGYSFGRRLQVRRLVPLLAAGTFGLFAMDVLSSTTAFLVRDTGSIQTMSDRIPLWRFLTDTVIQHSPLTGLGYYAASRVWAPQYNEGLGTAHSAFFEILLGGGVIAAALYVVVCGLMIWYSARLLMTAGDQPEVLAAAGLTIANIISGITSVSVHVGLSGFWFWSASAVLPTLLGRYGSRSRRAVARTAAEWTINSNPLSAAPSTMRP
jgi:O-antigen ligase